MYHADRLSLDAMLPVLSDVQCVLLVFKNNRDRLVSLVVIGHCPRPMTKPMQTHTVHLWCYCNETGHQKAHEKLFFIILAGYTITEWYRLYCKLLLGNRDVLRECTVGNQSCNKTANLLMQNRRKGKGIGLFLHYLCSNGKLFYATCELTPQLGLFKEGACDGETCGCRLGLTVLFPLWNRWCWSRVGAAGRSPDTPVPRFGVSEDIQRLAKLDMQLLHWVSKLCWYSRYLFISYISPNQLINCL